MRRFIGFAAMMIILSCLTPSVRGEGTWYLRIIGRDDTPAAQEEKMRVRQAVWAQCPQDAGNIKNALPAIQRAAEAVSPCRVEIRSWSPDGENPAAPTVYITLGEGKGHNWWGVLYEDALLWARADEGEEKDGEVVFLWPIWAWLCRLLGIQSG